MDSTVAIQFSPDGRRLIAGDNPGGVVHVWDVASGRRLTTFDMGGGGRSTHKYFVVTPDWKTILAPTNERGTFERVERDGRSLYRVNYNGSVRVWDLESGSLLHTWKTDPPPTNCSRDVVDNQFMDAIEDVPGEFESLRPRALSLWNLATGEHKQLFAGYESIEAFSADGKQAVVSVPQTEDGKFNECVEILRCGVVATDRHRPFPSSRCSSLH